MREGSMNKHLISFLLALTLIQTPAPLLAGGYPPPPLMLANNFREDRHPAFRALHADTRRYVNTAGNCCASSALQQNNYNKPIDPNLPKAGNAFGSSARATGYGLRIAPCTGCRRTNANPATFALFPCHSEHGEESYTAVSFLGDTCSDTRNHRSSEAPL